MLSAVTLRKQSATGRRSTLTDIANNGRGRILGTVAREGTRKHGRPLADVTINGHGRMRTGAAVWIADSDPLHYENGHVTKWRSLIGSVSKPIIPLLRLF